MKHRILLFFLTLTSLSSNARSIPFRDIMRDAYHDMQHSLLLLFSGALGSALLVFLVLFLIERKKKGKTESGDNLPAVAPAKQPQSRSKESGREAAPIRSIPEVRQTSSELEKKGETETVEETVLVVPFRAPLNSEDEKFLRNHLEDCFLLSSADVSLNGTFFWAEVLPGKTEGQTGPFVFCAGKATEKEKITDLLNKGMREMGLASPETLMQYVNTKEESLKENICCLFDLKGGWLRFAGKHIPLWLVRKGEVKEFPAGEGDTYTLQTLGLRKGDCIYFFSGVLSPSAIEDLKILCLASESLPMKEIKMELERKLNSFSDNFLVVGVRIV
jgi:hypothetical protein